MPRVKASERGTRRAAVATPYWRRPSLIALGALIAFVLLVLTWQSGWPQRQANRIATLALSATARLGFSVQSVDVEGRVHISKTALREALQVERGMPILALSPSAMLARLQTLPWLEAARIERDLPNRIVVRLTERKPLARWQLQNQLHVIDGSGRIIIGASVSDFAALPTVVGAGAAERAQDLLILLADYPEIRKNLQAATCVGERRWDLQLAPGMTVRLPEGKESSALKRLSELLAEQQLLGRAVRAVDLRFPDRLVIEPPQTEPVAAKNAKGKIKR